MNKKGQGLPLNVVIVGIIVIVVLIIVLVFFVGGTGQIIQQVRQVFGLNVQGQSVALAVESCSSSCNSVIDRVPNVQKNSLYCNAAIVVDNDGNADTPPVKMACGSENNAKLTVEADSPEGRQGIKGDGGDLGVPCAGIVCG